MLVLLCSGCTKRYTLGLDRCYLQTLDGSIPPKDILEIDKIIGIDANDVHYVYTFPFISEFKGHWAQVEGDKKHLLTTSDKTWFMKSHKPFPCPW